MRETHEGLFPLFSFAVAAVASFECVGGAPVRGFYLFYFDSLLFHLLRLDSIFYLYPLDFFDTILFTSKILRIIYFTCLYFQRSSTNWYNLFLFSKALCVSFLFLFCFPKLSVRESAVLLPLYVPIDGKAVGQLCILYRWRGGGLSQGRRGVIACRCVFERGAKNVYARLIPPSLSTTRCSQATTKELVAQCAWSNYFYR